MSDLFRLQTSRWRVCSLSFRGDEPADAALVSMTGGS